MKKIISIVGARPQFIKHAPMQIELQKYFNALTIHTGQHYDDNMSAVFFNELNIPKPEYIFDIKQFKNHGEQTGTMMIEIEKICLQEKPDALVIYGDTNSTLAGALVGAKLQIPIIHIEAGLRSFNRTMPEEINRIIADEFSALLFCPTTQAIENLKKEGITHENIFLCGDVMCDMIHLVKSKTKKIYDFPYYFATIHRPYNTDDAARLMEIIKAFSSLDEKVIFATHPRTIDKINSLALDKELLNNIIFIPPLSYTESISMQTYAEAILTDSGGIQKEAYILKKKCTTLRSETEWTETLQGNWNTLVFDDLSKIKDALAIIPSDYNENLFGNGHAVEQIVTLIHQNI
jgi:UDP-GlcNAc3NAcA epimerase